MCIASCDEVCRQLQVGHLYATQSAHHTCCICIWLQKQQQASQGAAGSLGGSAQDLLPPGSFAGETELAKRAAALKQAGDCLNLERLLTPELCSSPQSSVKFAEQAPDQTFAPVS